MTDLRTFFVWIFLGFGVLLAFRHGPRRLVEIALGKHGHRHEHKHEVEEHEHDCDHDHACDCDHDEIESK